MSQKVPVNSLRVGMHVSALDRAWTDVPFEPPFELQAFTIANQAEIAKIQQYCEYVYVDAALSRGMSKDKKEKSAEQKLGQKAPRELVTAQDEYADPRLRVRYRQQRYEKSDDDDRIVKQARLADIDNDETTSAAGASGGKDKDLAYPDLVSVEEEMETAREILADSEIVFNKVAKDIKDGRPIDGAAIKKNVESLVQSVVRNPDALSWLTKLKQLDGYTYSHSMAVCVLSLTIGRHLGLQIELLNDLGMGALFQDIGKLRIPAQLLEKQEPLEMNERQTIARHVELSVGLLKNGTDFPSAALEIVRTHHERYDGSGYPAGLKADAISPLGTIAGIADTYEAMINIRPYRPALNSFEALTELYEMRDKLFATAMIENLIQCVGVFPIGCFVELNTRHIGVVVSRNRIHQLKPRVMVLIDPKGNKLPTSPTVDLAAQNQSETSIPNKILRVVDAEEFDIDPRQFFS